MIKDVDLCSLHIIINHYLATGCYEKIDSGVTNFGREAIKEMNRVGIVIDMSHSAEQSTLDAIDISEKPIAITHANPIFGMQQKEINQMIY